MYPVIQVPIDDTASVDYSYNQQILPPSPFSFSKFCSDCASLRPGVPDEIQAVFRSFPRFAKEDRDKEEFGDCANNRGWESARQTFSSRMQSQFDSVLTLT